MTAKYTPTIHAIERAKHRFGVETAESQRWFNEIMRKATFLFSQKRGRNNQAVYETDEVRLIVDTDSSEIVTIYPLLDTSFLKPVFEREGRRVKREVIRNTRKHELNIAQLTVEMGERMLSYAKAKNPQTRASIQQEIDEFQAKISESESLIFREKDRLDNFVRATGVYA